jgi:hypothetical protein
MGSNEGTLVISKDVCRKGSKGSKKYHDIMCTEWERHTNTLH